MKKLSAQQQKNLQVKMTPQHEREYLVTDECFWKQNPPEDYNIYDKSRAPHSISLVDVETGTVVRLPSGSIIKVVHANIAKAK